ncbi:hypothetical protein [Saccharothrix australiensis]|uniref:Uncharacterized protein n=1 Tax=Saccharothrix australiensis TaxID=2072 RepID=A0A495VL97_9PSEU|nr:hypothetical protein [Saccharothrix australiensis]RKT49297.1 hypothetical protein C8E97_6793 [Saccharothrix australiensis]
MATKTLAIRLDTHRFTAVLADAARCATSFATRLEVIARAAAVQRVVRDGRRGDAADQCHARTVAEHRVVVDPVRVPVHIHPGPPRVERPAPAATVVTAEHQAAEVSGPAGRPADHLTVGELIVDAYLAGTDRLWGLAFGRGGR